ncbi:hypothetical protein SSS_09903 [Sarcoptes scabiei]|nr:hypothetical protein SSS_09903 [Sarcoptes scabiei]
MLTTLSKGEEDELHLDLSFEERKNSTAVVVILVFYVKFFSPSSPIRIQSSCSDVFLFDAIKISPNFLSISNIFFLIKMMMMMMMRINAEMIIIFDSSDVDKFYG